jgi:hypothetical protein
MARAVFPLFTFTAIIHLSLISSAFGYCSEPSFSSSSPDAPGSYEKPDVPYCLSSYKFGGKHTCEEYEIDAYYNEVEDYVRKLKEYVEEANTIASRARAFASDALDYAKCEAEEVTEQVK